MRRADRLFAIIQLLRRRKVVTAAFLAEELEISERTVYRDVRDLVASGTPIESEAGVGYRLRAEYDLPPLMFNEEEIQALVLGARIVSSMADKELAKASRSVLSKVRSVVPKNLEHVLTDSALFAPNRYLGARVSSTLIPLRAAITKRLKVELRYTREDGQSSQRVVRPLGASFWGRSWTLIAWCELREDFRTFRLDRIRKLDVLSEKFAQDSGKTLEDFMKRFGPDAGRDLGAL